jgi:hypothetical protein
MNVARAKVDQSGKIHSNLNMLRAIWSFWEGNQQQLAGRPADGYRCPVLHWVEKP